MISQVAYSMQYHSDSRKSELDVYSQWWKITSFCPFSFHSILIPLFQYISDQNIDFHLLYYILVSYFHIQIIMTNKLIVNEYYGYSDGN